MGVQRMRKENEVREMLDKLRIHRSGLSWWDDGVREEDAIIRTLLWVMGVTTSTPIDPEKWEPSTDEDN